MKEKIEKYKEVTETLKVLAHPIRLTLVDIMLTKGPTNVTTMYVKLQMPQSTISQHLSKLKAAKIITGTRKGLEIYYEVSDNRTKAILSSIVLNADFLYWTSWR